MDQNLLNPTSRDVCHVARIIADNDFRVTVSCYVTGAGAPWLISVGEGDWIRHLVVQKVGPFTPVGVDAELGILPAGLTPRFGDNYDILGIKPEVVITLKDLIAGSYSGVKKILKV